MNDAQTDRFIEAVKRLSEGGNDGATGTEALTMALVGEGRPGNGNIAFALHDIAEAIRELARAVGKDF